MKMNALEYINEADGGGAHVPVGRVSLLQALIEKLIPERWRY